MADIVYAAAVLDGLNALLQDNELVMLKFSEENGTALVIFRDCVTQRAYHSPTTVTWSTSNLRSWLNAEFFNLLPEEIRGRTVKTVIHTPANCAIPGGDDTEDYIFLLSIDEYRDFLPEELRVAHFHGNPCWWWLRSPGYSTGDVADVYPDGNLDGGIAAHGFYAFADCGGVRPAMYLKLA